MASANTLATQAQSLMDQVKTGVISFDSYRNSMNTIIAGTTNNPDFQLEENSDDIHTVMVAISISQGEAPRPFRPRTR